MRTGLFLFAAVLTVSSAAGGETFQANVRTAGLQANPAVALSDAGDCIVVWSSYFTSAGRSNDIVARRFDGAGAPRDEDEVQINVSWEGNQTEPDVAMTGAGRFVVAWQGPGLDAEDIFARVFDANGYPVTGELLVNAWTLGRQLCPRTAVNDSGAFAVAWESKGDPNAGERSFVSVRLFDPNGTARGGDVVVDGDIYDCRYPEIALDAGGGFAVTWLQDRTAKTVFAKLFDAAGAAVSEPFEVNTGRISSVTRPSIAMTSAGSFTIAWDGDPNRASLDDIHARGYEPNGVPCGEPFIVNAFRSGAQQWPRVAMNDAREGVVVWAHATDDPNIATDILARRFDGSGAPVGAEFPLGGHDVSAQRYPDVALAADGSFIAAWERQEADGPDYDICVHRAGPTVSADFNADGRVTFVDVAIFARYWRCAAEAPADLTRDAAVDARDLASLCRQWLK